MRKSLSDVFEVHRIYIDFYTLLWLPSTAETPIRVKLGLPMEYSALIIKLKADVL